MTPIATHPKTDRRYRHSSTRNDGARPPAIPEHRLKRRSIISTVAKNPTVVFAEADERTVTPTTDALGRFNHARTTHYPHSTRHHRA
jgi:hypothetical protein